MRRAEKCAADHTEGVFIGTRLARSAGTGTTISIASACAINGELLLSAQRAVVCHLPARTDHDRVARPRSPPAGRVVLAGLGAGVIVSCPSVLLLHVVRLAVGALECISVRARAAALAAAV